MKRCFILFSVVSLVLTGAVSASVEKGDTEIALLGGYQSTQAKGANDDVTEWFLEGEFGYFVTDNIQVGAFALGSWESEGDDDTDTYGLGIKARYHFMPSNQYVPYVGGQLGWLTEKTSGSPSEDGFMWGPVVGLRYELNAYNDLFVEYQYRMFTGDLEDNVDHQHGIYVGIVHQFK